MKTLLAFTLYLLTLPAFACVTSVTSTDTYVEICKSGVCARILLANLRNGSVTLQAEQVREVLQSWMQVRQALATLPEDDPDKGTNPAVGERLFWSDSEGNPVDTLPEGATHLTFQSCIVEAVEWDGVTFQLTIRRAN